MTELDKITDSIVALRASLALDMDALGIAERRQLRAHVEHCILDLLRLLSRLIAAPDAVLDGAWEREAGAGYDQSTVNHIGVKPED